MTAETPKLCALGEFTGNLAASYLDHIAGVDTRGELSPASLKEQLRKALQSANLPVTTNIISNLLKALAEHQREKKEKGSDSGLPISWGEFCACCIALHSHQAHTLRPSAPSPPPVDKTRPAPSKYGLSSTCKHEVFLGGSCNPTTWRLDTGIPTLQQAAITYFNPQVDEWYPELIEVEEQAKTAATLLLFVIDNQTRAISSMVEVAFLAGQERDLVAVVEDISADGAVIAGETLSAREVQDLNRGRLFTRNLVEESGCLLADSLQSALGATVKVVKENLMVKDYCSSCASRKLQYVPPSLGEELDLLHRVFIMYDNEKKNKLTLGEAELALRSLHIEGPTLHQLLATNHQDSSVSTHSAISFHQGSDSLQKVSHDLLQQYKNHGLTFDEFCCLYAELKYILLQDSASGTTFTNYISTPLRWIASWFWAVPMTTPKHPAPFVDLFLNGSCGNTTWRNDISIPILKQHGVSYFNPQVANWDRRLLPIEREAKERCSVLLYVITGETLSVASMVEAAYYIGKGRSVVLCVSDIPSEGLVAVEGMKLSAQATKDYNRGRAYLTSMANKSRVPVYSSIAAATMSAVHLALCVRGQKVQNQHSAIVPTSYTSSV